MVDKNSHLPASCGVYLITNKQSNDVYIGSSFNIRTRWRTHLKVMRKGGSSCVILQRAFTKYGEENFTCAVLELCSRETVRAKEQGYLLLYRPRYNATLRVGFGINFTPEVRQKMSDKKRGKPLSDTHRENLSQSLLGRAKYNAAPGGITWLNWIKLRINLGISAEEICKEYCVTRGKSLHYAQNHLRVALRG